MTITSRPNTFWIPLSLLFGFLIQINTSCAFGPPEGSSATQAERGKLIFEKQCKSCHGMDGVAATVDTLETKAKDLTRINKRRKVTTFPIEKIARYIDGRNLVKAHGPREMPVWGEVYKQEGMDETEIKGRKGELIAYLMSIQNYE
jgi:mono/diheme cytochrome c family protein